MNKLQQHAAIGWQWQCWAKETDSKRMYIPHDFGWVIFTYWDEYMPILPMNGYNHKYVDSV